VELPSEESLRWIVSRYASLRVENAEAIADPVLVQPTAEDFPDAFELTAAGVGRFLSRMLEYAPVASDLDVRLRVVDDAAGGGACGTKSETRACGSGACGTSSPSLGDRVVDADDAYIVEIPASAAGHPLRLAAALARSVGTIVLLEAGEDFQADGASPASPERGLHQAEVGPVSEVAAVAVGLGVLLLSGSYLFGKSCGGVRVEQCTHLDVMELAVAVSLFVRLHEHKPSRAKAHLEVTQREAFGEALAWVDSNPKIVADLEARPEMLADGVFPIRATQGFLGRWLSAPKSERDPAPAPVSKPARPRSEEEQKRLERARALVDEALREPSSS
jgi:hypothetical protein